MRMSSSFPSPPVGGLFLHGDPSAIVGLIASTVVGAVDGQSGWRFAHIDKEVLEGEPSIANGYASAAIPWPRPVVGIGASLNNGRPSGISRTCLAALIVPVRRVAGDEFVPVGASATPCASPEIGDGDDDLLAAIAGAAPKRTARHVGKLNDDQSPKSLTGDIFEGGHDGLSPGGCVKRRPRFPERDRLAIVSSFTMANNDAIYHGRCPHVMEMQ